MQISEIVNATLTSVEQLKALPIEPGPCISIYLPSYSHENSGVYLPAHHGLETARHMLASTPLPQSSKELLLQRLHDFGESGLTGDSLAIFLNTDFVRVFRIQTHVPESVHIANDFHITPSLIALAHTHHFYILALSQKHIRLVKCTDHSATPMPLPAGLPKSVQEAEGFTAPDHLLEARSAAGSSSEEMSRIHFGTDTIHEKADRYLHDFFVIIDRTVTRLLLETRLPILLAGTDRELALYRKLSVYPYLLGASMTGSPEHVADSELHARGLKAIKMQDARDEEQALLRLAEIPKARSLTDLSAVLAAARSGQIDHLFIEEVKATGSHEEIVNQIVLETVRHSGRISLLRYVAIPSGKPLAATLRYEQPQIA